jgi:4-amino-4-deoxy-L-arabinose transferase-like glycosyltransferase
MWSGRAARGPDARAAAVVVAVGSVAVAVRVAAALILDGFRHPDLSEYDLIARNLLEGRGFTYPHLDLVYRSYIAPLPAWLSAASYLSTGTLVPLMTLQMLAGAGTAMAAAAVGLRLFEGWVAPLATGLLVALHPGLIVYSASWAHSLAFDALFFTLTLLQTLRLGDRPTAGRAAWLGAIVGVGMLSRATIAVFLPLAWLWLFAVRRVGWTRALATVAISGVCAAAVVAPWTIRNTRLHGRFVLLLTTDSEVFWRGNNPQASGTSFVDERRTVLSTLTPEERADLSRQPNEVAQADWFSRRSRAFVREHPAAFLGITLRKLGYFWWYSPTAGLLYPRSWFWASHAVYVVTMALAGLGAWAAVRRRAAARSSVWLIAMFVVTLSLFQSLYYVEGRHRWAVEPMILVLSGGGVAAAARRFGGA